MKLFWLISFIFLAGCQSMDMNDETEIQSKSAAQSDIQEMPDSDDKEYLSIAKDLFAAKQYKQSYQIVRRLAQKNNPEAHYLLGYMLYYGYGVKADKKQGAQWIKKAADAGNRSAIEALVMIQYKLTPNMKCPVDGFQLTPSESDKHN